LNTTCFLHIIRAVYVYPDPSPILLMTRILVCLSWCICASYTVLAQSGTRPVTMPYNRSVQSAGQVITYGDPRLENHTLDVAPIPGSHLVVVEDRYGIAMVDPALGQIMARWSFRESHVFKDYLSTFSGIKAFVFDQKTWIVWGAATREAEPSALMIAGWNGRTFESVTGLPFFGIAPAPNALPNEVEVECTGPECYLYVVLNGNNQLAKVRFSDRSILWTAEVGIAPFGVRRIGDKVYVTNWGGPQPSDPQRETAGVPWGAAYVDPRTGATAEGSVTVLDAGTGVRRTEITVGLHPNALLPSPDGTLLYVANGNSDHVTVLDTRQDIVLRHIPVGLFQWKHNWMGSSPNGLALDSTGHTLYVSNGLDHAVAVVTTGDNPAVQGYIPTQAYPSGLICMGNKLIVTNLEAIGARVPNNTPQLRERLASVPRNFKGAYNAHEQLASLSIIPLPDRPQLARYTRQVRSLAQQELAQASMLPARPGMAPVPVPARIGEPSVFKHVVYIIKENRTYDQVYGDFKKGRGMEELCVFGDTVTPNQHRLAEQFVLLDNYHASGKSSAEGHQWASAGIVSDYVEKNVRGWFRSYPHRQYDAMVYTESGYIWNHALDHGKTVRIYGEACFNEFDERLSWTDIYRKYLGQEPFVFHNTSTISRVRPILSQTYPGYDDPKINDQLRAAGFIQELRAYEAMPGDSLPQLMLLALPNDHTAGTTPGYPTPRAQVADNDLALAKIVEALMQSRFWPEMVIFVSEDDSQNGWDHLSAYRTGALVISPYSAGAGVNHTYYNQTSLLRTIEQILGLPPMNTIDATATPMYDCFGARPQAVRFSPLPNRIPLDEMNKPYSELQGKALYYAQQSAAIMVGEGVDNGHDDLMNRILWFYARGEQAYPGK
ncbi:MAG: bifunctional YncE family protein/alkaline phosphatase family protein, partial [Bacteroidia bacterium]|nr:bifunctional YncE family protein/alkaline phosphatase family protein [Bacteroidia bacterium]